MFRDVICLSFYHMKFAGIFSEDVAALHLVDVVVLYGTHLWLDILDHDVAVNVVLRLLSIYHSELNFDQIVLTIQSDDVYVVPLD